MRQSFIKFMTNLRNFRGAKMAKKNIDLTIVVVNFQGAEWTIKLEKSLRQHFLSQSKYNVELKVVDNGSQDDSVKILRKHFPTNELEALPQNVGFAAANNHALKQSTARYVMLLNSDTELTPENNFEHLLEFLDQHPEVAVATPKVVFPTGQLDPASHRGEPTPWASFTYFAGLEKLFPKIKMFGRYHLTYLDLAKPHPIEACSGAAMIVRREALEKVGLLDESFFMYAEDLDWCKRFRDAGYQIYYLPSAKVIHHKYKSGQGNKDHKVAQQTRHHFYNTMLQYYDKHYRQQYPNWFRWLITKFVGFKKEQV